tara:strand:- start:164 stop:2980 length:2817 start_codon:yes stop_codon:yes gene_type:complete
MSSSFISPKSSGLNSLTGKLTASITGKLTRKLTGEELNRLFLEKFKFTTSDTELVTNGDFDTDTGWTKNSGWTIANGKATKNSGDANYMTADFTGNGTFEITFTVSDYVSGNVTLRVGTGFSSNTRTANGTYTETIDKDSATFGFFGSGEFSIDNVSVKEVTKQAPVAAFSLRKLGNVSPYAARIRRSYDNTEAQVFFDASDRVSESSVVRNTSQNLLSYSEDFGQWTNNGGGTASKAVTITDPFGGNNAWAVKGDTTNNWAGKFASISGMTTGTQYTVSLYLKKGTSTLSKFGIYDNNTSPNTINLDVAWSASGVPTNNTATTSALATNIKIEEVGTDGWYRCSFNAAALNVDGSQSFVIEPDRNASSDGTVYAFGAQLEETVTYLSTPNILYSEDFNTDAGGWLDTESGGSNTTLSQETTNPLSGSGSLKIALSNTGTSGGYPRVRKNTGTAFRTGIKYILSFKAKALSGTVECDIRFGTASTNMYWATDQTFTTTEQTYTYTDTFDTLPTAGTDAIQFIFDGTKGPFELLIDDVKVEIFDNAIPSEYISTPVVSNDGLTFTETTLDDFVGGENLLVRSNEFTHSDWNNPTMLTAGATTSPTGATNASEIVSGTSAIYDAAGTSGSAVTVSIYAKKKTVDFLTLSAGNPTTASATFDLTDGTVAQEVGTVTAHVSDEGNGWYRIGVSCTSGGYIQFSAKATGSYAASRTSGVYVYGAQINTGSTVKPYQETTGTARAGDASVVVLYNQTGGEDAIQDTQPHQPLLYNAGLLVKSGSSPAIEFDGTNTLRIDTLAGQTRLDSYFIIDTSDSTYVIPSSATSGSHYGIYANDATSSSAGNYAGSASFGTPNVYKNGAVFSTSTLNDVHDGLTGQANLVTMEGASTSVWNSFTVGHYFNNSAPSFNYTGKISEMIFFTSNESSNRNAIESDINDFHNIF